MTDIQITKHHKTVPILSLIVGLPLAILCLFIIIGTIVVRDEAAPNDQALIIPAVTVADEDNAFIDIPKQSSEAVAPTDPENEELQNIENLVVGTWDEVEAQRVVTKYRTDIDSLHAAAKKPYYQDPFYADPATVDWNNFPTEFVSPRTAARAMAIEARQKAKAGDITGALNQDVEIVKLGHMMEQGNVSLISYLVGSAVKHIGLSAIRTIATETAISTETAKTISTELEKYRDSRQGQITAVKMEYNTGRKLFSQTRTMSDLTKDFYLDGDNYPPLWATTIDTIGLGHYYFLPNQSWRIGIEMTKDRLQRVSVACNEIDTSPESYRTFLSTGPLRFVEPNAVGKYILQIGQVSYGGIVEKRCNESVSTSATQAALGASAYKTATSKTPASLDDISPTYLPVTPLDPYSNDNLRYIADTGVVYSIGPQKQDVGGSPVQDPLQQQKNPSFKIIE